jgi:hypothetical protein
MEAVPRGCGIFMEAGIARLRDLHGSGHRPVAGRMNSLQQQPKFRFADSRARISATGSRSCCRRHQPPVETGGWNFGKSAFADCTPTPLLRALIRAKADAAASRCLRGFPLS